MTSILGEHAEFVAKVAAGHRDADRAADIDKIRIDHAVINRAALPAPIDHASPEQNVQMALAISDYGYVLAEGKSGIEGPARQLIKDKHVREAYLGL